MKVKRQTKIASVMRILSSSMMRWVKRFNGGKESAHHRRGAEANAAVVVSSDVVKRFGLIGGSAEVRAGDEDLSRLIWKGLEVEDEFGDCHIVRAVSLADVAAGRTCFDERSLYRCCGWWAG